MLINERCTVCHQDIEPDDAVVCELCETTVHDGCTAYETAFECPKCADDPVVGVIEL
ncbi:hypothetical protein SAMN04487948_10766 [Halogranum amylolyticum]|uniref:RING-type domain-containing protein n=1 Tax=Halogranum amylolyticum TaxID=660520 RepID=A0A1H8TJ28_9EURY|nr:hypothetical protein [Halogranum amylolyticum]SEO90518.1 hypothetical protein SAMN04487948_10766 [Halogranum amylolyticum]